MTHSRCVRCGGRILQDALGWYHTSLPLGPDGKPDTNPPPCKAIPGGKPVAGQADLFEVTT